MDLKASKEWCLLMAELEGDAAIGAGCSALGPTFDGVAKELQETAVAKVDQPVSPFRRLDQLLRRERV